MKTLLTVYILILGAASSWAQGGSQLINALSQGNYDKVSRHFAPKLEICFGDEVYFLPKAKAAAKFRSIMTDLQPQSITPLHKGVSDNRVSKYIIGEVNSRKGNYRIFIFAKKRGQQMVIKEVRIEPY